VKKTLFALLLLCKGLFVLYAQGLPSVRVVNNTGYDIYNLYISPTISDEWGDQLLGDEILEDGDVVTITLSQPLSKINHYDFKVDDEERIVYYKLDIIVTNNVRIVFTLDDLYTGAE
jgi:methylglyoxal synthase